MNFNKIMKFFCIGLPICIIARIFQIVKTIEYSNGFYIEEFKVLGGLLLALIFVVCAVLAVCAFKAYKTPEKPPKKNLGMGVLAFCVALALINEAFSEVLPYTMLAWQVFALKLVTVFCAIYFVVIGLRNFMGVKVSALLHVIPCFYAVVKTIFTFISISSLALISDNILLMAGYCLLMLFFINCGKLYNNLDTELNFRKILATGLTASTICITQSLSYFAVNIFSSEKYLHADKGVMLALMALGAFVLAFTVSYFRETKE